MLFLTSPMAFIILLFTVYLQLLLIRYLDQTLMMELCRKLLHSSEELCLLLLDLSC